MADNQLPVPVLYVEGEPYSTHKVKELLRDHDALKEQTEQMRKDLEASRLRVSELGRQKVEFTNRLRSELKELVEGGDLERDQANDLLRELNVDLIPVTYEARFTVHVTGTIEAGDEDEATAAIEEASVDIDLWQAGTDWEISDTTISDIDLQEG